MNLTKTILGLACLAAAALAHAQPMAADTPAVRSTVGPKTPASLRMVVPFPAGGGVDVLTRLVAEKVRGLFVDGVVVDNKAGAGGNIGAEFVYRSPPDGSTLLASAPGPIAINQNLYKKLAFDPKQWVPVTVLAIVPNVLAVRSGLPVNNAQEFIDYAKKHSGKLTFASQGNGSTAHLTASLFLSLTGTTMTHVPYRGTAPAVADLMAGHVDLFFADISSLMQPHKAGRVRILATAGSERSAAMPDIPTFAEAGLRSMQAVTWYAVVAPPGTPAALAERYQAAMSKALAEPDVKASLADIGAVAGGWPEKRTSEFFRSQAALWEKVIVDSNVQIE